MKKKKNILLLFCGGTISMKKGASGALESHYSTDQLLKLEPRIKELAHIKAKIIANVDSTLVHAPHWEKLVSAIAEQYQKFDGFLITHGTNTMGYTSSALSFALPNIGKPVVLTGAQMPAEAIGSDARNNLLNALRVATLDIGGVFVVFGSKIILGSRAKKASESELDAFRTFNQSDFGEVRIGIKINDKTSHKAHSKPLKVRNGFDDTVLCYTLIPGMKGSYLINAIDDGVKGIILRAFGSGDVPYDMLDALRYAARRQVPVVVTTQCPNGATIMGINDNGLQALKTGVIQAFDMSMEAMSTKLMWCLGQGMGYKDIKKIMPENLVGEVNPDVGIVFG